MGVILTLARRTGICGRRNLESAVNPAARKIDVRTELTIRMPYKAGAPLNHRLGRPTIQ
jgi:hypothetical protein